MSRITTHVLDLTFGRPGAGIAVTLVKAEDTGWQPLASATTDDDGRVTDFDVPNEALGLGCYRLIFELDPYFAANDTEAFFPCACVEFRVDDPEEHYHVPLLLSAFGYSTYRGS